MIKSYGEYWPEQDTHAYTSLRNEEFQFICNNLVFELKDHNYSAINPGFVSRTLVQKDFQHTINSLHFLIEGAAELDFDGQKMPLKAGDIFLIGNHVKCSWEYAQPSVEITLLFNFYLGNLDDLFSTLSKPLLLHGCMEDVYKMRELFELDQYAALFEMKQVALSYTLRFLEMSAIDLTRHIKLVKKYERVFRYINEHPSMGLHLREIAQATNYSVSFFTKSFARDNAVTVKQYIHSKLMSETEQLLLYSDLPLTEIANRYAFCELSYFTRWFQKYKGCTPSQYRKQFRQTMQYVIRG